MAWPVDFAALIASPSAGLAALHVGRLIHFIRRRRARPNSRAVVEIPAIQHRDPVAHAAGADECLLHVGGVGMESSVLDPLLAHAPTGQRFAVNLRGDLIVREEGVTLLMNGWS